MDFGVLGPVVAWDDAGRLVGLKGPRHRAVLARLIVARGRVVPASLLVDDLWVDPPEGALSAVRTFVAALRRALEPERAPRSPARFLVTEGPGYALRTDAVDAWRFERAVGTALPPGELVPLLSEALAWWRGPAYAEFADEGWAQGERSRLTELRLRAVERLGEARLALGHAAEAVPELDAHVTEHPWREDAWRLLALALYRTGRQGDALAVLRRARAMLVRQLGVDPGPALGRLETDILNQAAHLEPVSAGHVWAEAAAAYDRAVGGTRARLESTVGLLRNLAVTGGGGLEAARRHRLAAIAAAEELGDADLTARVIGAYDVPAIWTRSDDESHAAAIVAAAERVLPTQEHPGVRAWLLATIALESRGSLDPRAREAALEAESIARGLDDPALLAFALNGVFMQTCYRAGLAADRSVIGAELVELSQRHGLFTYEVLGHLICLQSSCAMADHVAADHHAEAADELAARHELPLVAVFTRWYAALREDTPEAYRQAGALLDNASMPGLQSGLLPLALACYAIRHDEPVVEADYGPHAPWVHPLVLLSQNHPVEAAEALDRLPDPAPGLLLEAHWALVAAAAKTVNHRQQLARARAALAPAATEEAGAGSGLLTLGPVATYL
ncbi:SARP family transcriptional regulator [Kribbella capetownensis]|uniref:SARP family transcriptional regulator n=1 Tax=Kribbella capetownensis TaxID=1572659 RepID=A0A4R0K731_9ACTN|nr:BTAD domain-containing putative transcriptional regulator [Kribbella capetownensis]TCC53708.1 SARP family transcriptional regulator [Kribbella capetownensis]